MFRSSVWSTPDMVPLQGQPSGICSATLPIPAASCRESLRRCAAGSRRPATKPATRPPSRKRIRGSSFLKTPPFQDDHRAWPTSVMVPPIRAIQTPGPWPISNRADTNLSAPPTSNVTLAFWFSRWEPPSPCAPVPLRRPSTPDTSQYASARARRAANLASSPRGRAGRRCGNCSRSAHSGAS